MDSFSSDDLRELIKRQEGLCVSIFLQTYKTGPDVQQNPIRFKNLLGEAEEQLRKMGFRSNKVGSFLQPARRLLRNTLFWQHQDDGLAVFLSPTLFRNFCLPSTFEDLAVVTDRFHVKPLIPLLGSWGKFYILALSQKKVRLLQGTHYKVFDVDIEEVPKGLADALKYDDPQRQLQFHTGTPSSGGKRPAIYHGQGVGTDEAQHKVNILRYFQMVDSGLHEFLKGKHEPLVLAGVEYLLPIYRDANSYQHLIDEGISGNPDNLSAKELHDQAWAIVEPFLLSAQQEDLNTYENFKGTGRTSNDVKEVVQAAYHKRVAKLFVALGLHKWGSFDPDTDTVKLHEEGKPGDEDLLDFAAVHTLLSGGTLHVVEQSLIPDNAPLAAIFRY